MPGGGGFHSHPDDYYLTEHHLPLKAIRCGSDLRALTPRELLAVFVGLRGRHLRDTGRWTEAAADWTLARWLFPGSRRLYVDQMALAVPQGAKLFEPGEIGSPESLAEALLEQYGVPNGPRPTTAGPQPAISEGLFHEQEVSHASARNTVYTYDYSGKVS
ncbi:MAG: hypothetical protein L0Z62_27620 [Gemmataceae bacterium]|nr:hypothetical protein [Gemmataceae bacterium]